MNPDLYKPILSGNTIITDAAVRHKYNPTPMNVSNWN